MLQAGTRIYELGPGTEGWEEIDYVETSFFVHSAENFELEVVFVLDFTKSMALAALPDGRSGIEVMLEAFETALTGLPGAHRAGVVEFHDRNVEPGVLSQLTTDRDFILDSVAAFASSSFEPGSSRVWDSIQTAADLFTDQGDNPNVVRALVFLSDGRDTSSVSAREDAGAIAAQQAIQLYAVGVGEVYEEEELEATVVANGGVYYPTKELAALQDQLQVLVNDLRGQYRLTYITLRRWGEYQTRVDFDLPDAIGRFETDAMEVSTFYGPDTEGRITFDPPSVDRENGTAQVFIRALHVPRNVSSFRFKLDTLKPFVADIVPEDDGGLLGGWTLSERDSEGYQVAEGAEPVAFGNFGLLFEINLSDIIEKNVAIPVVFDNSIYTAGQSLQHPAELYIGERIVGSGNIAFRSNRSGDFDVYAMKFDGTDQTKHHGRACPKTFVPAWSPGGAQIAFGSDRIGLRQIYVMNADGSEVERLTGLASTNSLPAWSPDGQQIAFTSDRDGNRNVYVMNANGSRETPAYQPSGTRLVASVVTGRNSDRLHFAARWGRRGCGCGGLRDLHNHGEGRRASQSDQQYGQRLPPGVVA